MLQKTDVCKIPAIRSVLKKFAKLDIRKEIKEFEKETQKDMDVVNKKILINKQRIRLRENYILENLTLIT